MRHPWLQKKVCQDTATGKRVVGVMRTQTSIPGEGHPKAVVAMMKVVEVEAAGLEATLAVGEVKVEEEEEASTLGISLAERLTLDPTTAF